MEKIEKYFNDLIQYIFNSDDYDFEISDDEDEVDIVIRDGNVDENSLKMFKQFLNKDNWEVGNWSFVFGGFSIPVYKS